MPSKFQKFIARSDLCNNPVKYFVFGDNVQLWHCTGLSPLFAGYPHKGAPGAMDARPLLDPLGRQALRNVVSYEASRYNIA